MALIGTASLLPLRFSTACPVALRFLSTVSPLSLHNRSTTSLLPFHYLSASQPARYQSDQSQNWKGCFYFFHNKKPFVEVRELCSKGTYPSHLFEATSHLSGKYQRIAMNSSTRTAFYVYTYPIMGEERMAASDAKMHHFNFFDGEPVDMTVTSPILSDFDYKSLTYDGPIRLIFSKDDPKGENPHVSQYSRMPELARTKQFADRLREVLPKDNFSVSDQTAIYHYCKFRARVEVVVQNAYTPLIIFTHKDEGAINDSFPGSLVAEYNISEQFDQFCGQTCAEMLQVLSVAAVNCLKKEKRQIDVFRCYGICISGDRAIPLEMIMSCSDGHLSVYTFEEARVQDVFNYLLKQIDPRNSDRSLLTSC